MDQSPRGDDHVVVGEPSSSSSLSQSFVDSVEARAVETVQYCKQFIDILRSSLPAPVTAKELNQAIDYGDISLYESIASSGFRSDVHAHFSNVRSLVKDQEPATAGDLDTSILNEPLRVAVEILIPLIKSLTALYTIIDKLPQPESPPAPSKDRNNATRTKNRAKNKPIPPKGMLSIQDYTDIACLLEFTICTAIIPQLDENILLPIQDRIRLLPKTITGRLPRRSLGWGLHHKTPTTDQSASFLSEIVEAIANLVFLDRFRPMLLPRHVGDLFAGLFQAEHLLNASDDGRIRAETECIYKTMGIIGPSIECMVDSFLQAKAYQALLLQGTKSPQWLRHRVSSLLNRLACRDLPAIIQAFIPEQDPSAASKRLGRALSGALVGDGAPEFCRQVFQVLETCFPVDGVHHPGQIASCLTIWEILYNIPAKIIRDSFIPYWQEKITESGHVDKVLHQIGGLVSWIPPSTNPGKVLQILFLSPIEIDNETQSTGAKPSLLGQLVRIASIQAVLQNTAKEHATMDVAWIVQGLSKSSFSGKIKGNPVSLRGSDVLAMVLPYCLINSSWDLAGFKYIASSENRDKDATVIVAKQEFQAVPETVSKGMEQRITTIIDALALQLKGSSSVQASKDDKDPSGEDEVTDSMDDGKVEQVVCVYFRLMIGIYFSSRDSAKNFPNLFQRHLEETKLVAMLSLPLLCEKVSHEVLLLGDSDGAVDMLEMIKIVLYSAATVGSHRSTNATGIQDCAWDKCWENIGHFLDGIFSVASSVSRTGNISDMDVDSTELMSLASVVLSLFIALLEMGASKRSAKEEEVISSFLPALESIVNLTSTVSVVQESAESTFRTSLAELADMSSYAMAMVGSRNAPPRATSTSFDPILASRQETIISLLKEAEEDLGSTQPPMRARAMVSLGKLARGYLSDDSDKTSSSLIVELGSDNEMTTSTMLTREILRLALIALSDKESYVYLAAVQTLVALGETVSPEVIPDLASAVATGSISIPIKGSKSNTERLTNEQRCKMADSLIFTIRRRAARSLLVAPLINAMLFTAGGRISSGNHSGEDAGIKSKVLESTHDYFVGPGPSAEEETIEEKRAEMDIRINTGGPVFDSEEADVVRAARVSIVAELVSSCDPSSVAEYGQVLTGLCISALRLDNARMVTRASALLARELYGAVLREYEGLNHSGGTSSSESPHWLSMEVFKSREDLLHAVLLQMTSESLVPKDPATSARCEEALALREQLEESGFVQFTKLAIAAMDQDKSPNILQIVKQSKTPLVKELVDGV